jgi:hypothetical protein
VELLASYVSCRGDPRDFYLELGFEETDRMEEGEHVLRIPVA